MSDMFLTGYHGTSRENAYNIIGKGSYNLSKGSKDWLGSGIYFYPEFADAYEWRDSEVVLHSIIKIKESQFLDMETQEAGEIYNDAEEKICAIMGGSPSAKRQENQCALMKLIWDMYPEIQVISAEFAKVRTLFPTLMDKRPRRREFCLRNNTHIKVIQLIRREDLE